MLEKAKAALLAAYHKTEDSLLPEEIDRRRDVFLTKYSSELLIKLSGSELLATVHGDGPRNGLFYNLEFAEQYAPFGSIGGGSALKFKVYKAGDGSGYRKKGIGNRPVPCTEAEAERMTADSIVLLHRALLTVDEHRLPAGDPRLWLEFERAVTSDNPPSLAQVGHDSPVALLGWTHKYLAICRPDLFSFHHQTRQLANHLVRLGEAPGECESRFLLDLQWRELRINDSEFRELHPALLMRAAYDTFGNNTRYWRISTDEHDEPGQIDRWPEMKKVGVASIGWNYLEDLTDLLAGLDNRQARERLRQVLSVHEDNVHLPVPLINQWASQIHEFYATVRPGDRVVAMNGSRLLSVGEVTGEYKYDPTVGQPHHRDVLWHDVPSEIWPNSPGLQTTLCDFSRRTGDAVRVERLLLSSEPLQSDPREEVSASLVREERAPLMTSNAPIFKPLPVPEAQPLTHFEQRVKEILDHKGQVILYGPPGTGKTHHARQAARELAAREAFGGRSWAMINDRERHLADELIEFITFHPAYAYEDFIEGYRPAAAQSGGPAFELRDGLFLEICNRARKNPERHQILLIDEINRGNVAAVMGELMTLLEHDKREHVAVVLPLSRRTFRIPRNVWIVGTMNTADRSISLLDTALRRRFGFIEMLPDPDCIDVDIDGLSLSALLTEINARIRKYITRNARELQVGHAYFMRGGQPLPDKETLLAVFRDEIIPLLAEYCFENYVMLARILGSEIIDAAGQVPNADVLADADLLHGALRRFVSVNPARQTEQMGSEKRGSETEFEELDGEDATYHNAGIRRTV